MVSADAATLKVKAVVLAAQRGFGSPSKKACARSWNEVLEFRHGHEPKQALTACYPGFSFTRNHAT